MELWLEGGGSLDGMGIQLAIQSFHLFLYISQHGGARLGVDSQDISYAQCDHLWSREVRHITFPPCLIEPYLQCRLWQANKDVC